MTSALRIVEDKPDPFLELDTRRLYTVNIYNTDDALTQGQWSAFQKDVRSMVTNEETALVHGLWYTSPTSNYQAMSLSFNLTGSFPEMAVRTIKGFLTGIHEEYQGCTIQWTEAEVKYL